MHSIADLHGAHVHIPYITTSAWVSRRPGSHLCFYPFRCVSASGGTSPLASSLVGQGEAALLMSPSAQRHHPSHPPSCLCECSERSGWSRVEDGCSWRARGGDRGSCDTAGIRGDGWGTETQAQSCIWAWGRGSACLFFKQGKIPMKPPDVKGGQSEVVSIYS